MIKLHDVDSGALLGTITEEQLKVLVEQLEEESPEDRDYYIDADTIEMFEEATEFARQGLAVLIYDKRSVGYTWFRRSYSELADDALGAVRTLRAHPASIQERSASGGSARAAGSPRSRPPDPAMWRS